jgi:protein-S-isoprenylcysteine O-methyltransferase Ste14
MDDEDRFRRPGPIPPVYFLLGLASQVLLHHLLPAMQLLGHPWWMVGVLLIASGIGLAVWGNLRFRRQGTPVRPFEPSTALVQDGPFVFTRNPMYLGMLVVLIGNAMVLGSLSPWLVVPIFLWLITSLFIVHEEAMMETLFGEAYSDYRRRVRRWI